jgi:multiple sugar transport system substrate-binding protein
VVRSDIIPSRATDLGVLVPLGRRCRLGSRSRPRRSAGDRGRTATTGRRSPRTRGDVYKQALDEAGVGVPETFDDLRASAPKVAETGNYLLAEADAAGWQVLPFIWSNGGDVTDEDITTSEGYLNGPKSVEAIELLVDLYEQQAMPKLILGGGGGKHVRGPGQGMYATITDGPGRSRSSRSSSRTSR